jgi:hypothetical protein
MPKETGGSATNDSSLPEPINVIGELGAAGREVASEIVEEFSAAALKFLDDRKSSAAKTVHGVATIFQRAARDLDEESPPLAKYAGRSGAAIEAFSEQLRNSRWSEFVGQTRRLSEERPLVFLLVCAGLGVTAGALLVASAHQSARTVPGPARRLSS